jgi:hypothetical protein
MSEVSRPTIENKPSPSAIAESTDKASHEENSNTKSICASCEVTAMVVYDNEYATPVWGIKHNLHVDDEEVITKVALSAEEVTPAKLMGTTSYKYEPSFFPPTKVEVELVDTKAMTIAEINTKQEKIYKKIDTFYKSIETSFIPWSTVWAKDGWSSVPRSYQDGTLKGFEAWKKDEIGFWKSMGGVIADGAEATGDYLVDKANNGPFDREVNLGDNMLANALEVPVEGWILLFNMAYGTTDDAIEGISNGFNSVVNFLDSVMDFLKALATGSADGMMKALESLGKLESGDISKITNEIFEALKDASNEASKGLAALIELMGRTAVVERLAVTLGSIILLMTPNFLAEMAGTVAGYVIPTIIAGIIFTIIAALLSAVGVGEALFVSRIAKYMKDLKVILNRLKNGMGAIFIKIFDFIEKIFGEIGKFLKKLMDAPTNLTMHPSNKKYTGVRSGHIGIRITRNFPLKKQVELDAKDAFKDVPPIPTHNGVEYANANLVRADKTLSKKDRKQLLIDTNAYSKAKNLVQADIAIARVGTLDAYMSDSFRNIYRKQDAFNAKGITTIKEKVIDGKKNQFIVIKKERVDEYMKEIKDIYKDDPYNMEMDSKVKDAILKHIKENNYELSTFDGHPGLHADVLAVNRGLLDGKSAKELELAVYRLAKSDKAGKKPQGSEFPACKNCTGIIKHLKVHISTGETK